ncbi:hypothetical protein D3C80_756460 [compost metagenome]
MVDLAAEGGLPREAVGQRGGKHAATGNQVLGIDRFTGLGRHIPAAFLLAIVRGNDTGTELDILAEIQTVCHVVQPLFGFRLGGEAFGRLPRLIEFLGEPVLIDLGLGVETGAGVAVPIPGAADTGGRVVGADFQSHLAKAMQLIQAGYA